MAGMKPRYAVALALAGPIFISFDVRGEGVRTFF
jgi:hypothetical protein